MQKQAPGIARILIAAGFALSCFALLLFLWLAFGGPVPLKSQSYRFMADFPEASSLAVEADVRIAGVNVGKVKSKELGPQDARVNGEDVTRTVIEIDPEFAPISANARAMLRQKTLLGETYIELTRGDPASDDAQQAPISLGAAGNVSDAQAERVEPIAEGGHLANARVEEATQIDEVFQAFDEPTRKSFRRWLANSAIAISDRGLELNAALGDLDAFVADAANLAATLNRQSDATQGLIRDTGVVFEALTARDQELARAITGSNQAFEALASEQSALAETFQILPTFQRETRATLRRLDRFQANTTPLVEDLIPVARDLSPTLDSVRRLSPSLRDLFSDLDRLNEVSREGLPAFARVLDGFGPVFDALDPFLANLNPAIAYLRAFRHNVTDFLAGPPSALADTLAPVPGQPAPRHALRQLSYISAESLSVHQERLPTNRGNGYLPPLSLNSERANSSGIFPNFDCKNTDYDGAPGGADTDEDELRLGERNPEVNHGEPPDVGFAPCIITNDFPSAFGGERAPQLFANP